ncbi:hypothetical protein JQU17_00060 [Ponticoccus sp. SC2-23]|uniref:hypothetical protein n=1 Tax=Alexandriicola marinus TaxID=2081710 RepID=UPI0013E0DD58|nr:hypothetical protein [Alexandriicola marinus]MBM1224357.1 hypothetical protein [Ponticoccus sp. SC6-15]MBM1233323.1 hypothetical protein [Ponticoccus sp. SC6-45]MBM1236727.1 hypothetical protein [Ponticoccus sp. SC6-49]MBM1242334.1 hypothetical protein [Ponticoccus sp. SC2-64]MBM1251325.1 hypothetical protein [Ponticoccus sp. SC6-33]MBM1263561.1 hypothetical protein [Ponticoccus sp. SC2-67]MBM1290663.1 hypothetical protein [Ponticoccus sp. SC6-11]MBM1304043.1 hypothetical protein [Pontic
MTDVTDSDASEGQVSGAGTIRGRDPLVRIFLWGCVGLASLRHHENLTRAQVAGGTRRPGIFDMT